MKPKEYRDKCSDLLKEFNQMIADGPDVISYKGSDKLLREFRHLVYAFDPKLPLNEELDAPNALRLLTPYMGQDAHKDSVSRIRGFMEFFIHYIEEYYE